MITRYRTLRFYCQQNDWAAGLSAGLLIILFGATLYASLEYPAAILEWLSGDLFLNSVILLAGMAFISGFSLFLLCLSSCPCSRQEEIEKLSYRHRPVMCETLKMVKNLGGNPKRRRTPGNSGSA